MVEKHWHFKIIYGFVFVKTISSSVFLKQKNNINLPPHPQPPPGTFNSDSLQNCSSVVQSNDGTMPQFSVKCWVCDFFCQGACGWIWAYLGDAFAAVIRIKCWAGCLFVLRNWSVEAWVGGCYWSVGWFFLVFSYIWGLIWWYPWQLLEKTKKWSLSQKSGQITPQNQFHTPTIQVGKASHHPTSCICSSILGVDSPNKVATLTH